jgi:hypothetical protein
MAKRNTKIKVHIFLNGKEIKPSELSNITICNSAVNKIVNSIVDNMSLNNVDEFKQTM